MDTHHHIPVSQAGTDRRRRFAELGLTPEQRAARHGGLGGSDATIIMHGAPHDLQILWEEKRGVREPPDFSDVLHVAMGHWCEDLNLSWFERTTGRLCAHERESRVHPEIPWMRCTLDALTTAADGGAAVLDAKTLNAFTNLGEAVEKYTAQLHHQMMVCGLERAILSCFIGTLKYVAVEVAFDWFYAAQLLDAEQAFWQAVQDGTPPVPPTPPLPPPPPPEAWVSVDMTGSNAWAAHADDWLRHRAAAKAFGVAEKEIKALVEPGVGTASGHGIVVKRAKSGALSIRAEA
jgi:predicted phage-related endonuclease